MKTNYTHKLNLRGLKSLILAVGFALGIVRVQYRIFIGTGAQRSPAKPDPFLCFTGKGNAQILTNF
ncbi:hypothetical protein DRW42_03665 [Pedobacter miscanthi]|uniref:Uncharacterized protein n=1 Tax=Pedobacter miscanthi TaxID=2259170 RepID=A0A366LE58_9SPHI|nr:hypothetical protein DRW42_03665 [Pedobacter miscanthi]